MPTTNEEQQEVHLTPEEFEAQQKIKDDAILKKMN